LIDRQVYTLRLVFSDREVISCFGLAGLIETVPQLDAGIYTVHDRIGRDDGVAERHENGDWLIELGSGVRAGPGYIVI
jgi:hypothetical protein